MYVIKLKYPSLDKNSTEEASVDELIKLLKK